MGGNCVEYEIKIKNNVPALLEGKKKALTSSCGQENHLQAAYFIMRKLLSIWIQQVLLDPSAKPEPASGPEISASRLFLFVERSKELMTFVKKAIQKKGKSIKTNEETEQQHKTKQLLESTPLQVQFH